MTTFLIIDKNLNVLEVQADDKDLGVCIWKHKTEVKTCSSRYQLNKALDAFLHNNEES